MKTLRKIVVGVFFLKTVTVFKTVCWQTSGIARVCNNSWQQEKETKCEKSMGHNCYSFLKNTINNDSSTVV